MDYLRPKTVDEALAALASGARALAGATDLYPLAGVRLEGKLVDLADLPGFSGISQISTGLRIGACCSWTTIAEADLPPALLALQQAALQIGGRQVQNAGTIAGNICNASPAADGVPPLLALQAGVEVQSPGSKRVLPLEEFILGPRKVVLVAGELVTAILIPQSALAGRSAFQKLGARAHLVISIASAAVRLVTEGDQITQAFVAVGSCSPVARRVPSIEAALCGSILGAATRVDPAEVAAALSPIDDIRATAEYRRETAAELIRRAVEAAL